MGPLSWCTPPALHGLLPDRMRPSASGFKRRFDGGHENAPAGGSGRCVGLAAIRDRTDLMIDFRTVRNGLLARARETSTNA